MVALLPFVLFKYVLKRPFKKNWSGKYELFKLKIDSRKQLAILNRSGKSPIMISLGSARKSKLATQMK